jgi:hypothetical protein
MNITLTEYLDGREIKHLQTKKKCRVTTKLIIVHFIKYLRVMKDDVMDEACLNGWIYIQAFTVVSENLKRGKYLDQTYAKVRM